MMPVDNHEQDNRRKDMVSTSPLDQGASCLCRWEVVGTREGLSVSDAEARVPPTAQGGGICRWP